jgi:hypothetical protein
MEPYGDAGVPMRAGSDGACSGIACLRTWETRLSGRSVSEQPHEELVCLAYLCLISGSRLPTFARI